MHTIRELKAKEKYDNMLKRKNKVIKELLSRIANLEYEVERLNNIIKTKDEGIKAFTEDLCEESTKIEKATEYIKKHTYHATPKKLQNGIYERGILLIKSDFDIEELLEILDKGSDKE